MLSNYFRLYTDYPNNLFGHLSFRLWERDVELGIELSCYLLRMPRIVIFDSILWCMCVLPYQFHKKSVECGASDRVKARKYGHRVLKWEGGTFHPLFLLSH